MCEVYCDVVRIIRNYFERKNNNLLFEISVFFIAAQSENFLLDIIYH